MAVLQKKITVAAGVESPNVFANTEYEYLSDPARITLSCVGTSDLLTVRWTVGSIILIDDASFFTDTSGGFPVIPDNVLDSEGVPPGQHQVLTFKNDDTDPKDVYYRLDIDF